MHLNKRLPQTRDIRAKLVTHGQRLLGDGHLTLAPAARTPLGWSVRNFLHYASLPGALLLPWLLAIPFLVSSARSQVVTPLHVVNPTTQTRTLEPVSVGFPVMRQLALHDVATFVLQDASQQLVPFAARESVRCDVALSRGVTCASSKVTTVCRT